ncbi:hypothetical protein RhiJN_13144 [Ceratobasidium sp. AG-Ba]|nr:hypothetical protein RhiJN_08776 [Ceratobasidium sp. AG-Ba]QRV85126.1 hypothetical protein RhiJN_13144 [Ceratobasidium sp. AG-Ba]QRW13708.1 hypothetical protein RhiLY_12707 [Ceratobasidium sp. AG-Ba]
MPKKSSPLPFNMQKIWGTTKCRSEEYVLDTEAEGRLGSGESRIRYLTDFIFVKDGKIVFPLYEMCTQEFWKGVEVYGFMTGPTSSIDRWYIWSLHWWLTKQQVELVRIDNVIGIEKQNDPRYRNGNQQVLWLNSRKRYSYALMEPDESVAAGWNSVILSWRPQGRDGLPVCVQADPNIALPDWWHQKGEVAGRAAWQALQRAWEKKKKEEEDEEDADDDGEERADAKKQQKRKNEAEEDSGPGKRRKPSGSADKGKKKEEVKVVAKPQRKGLQNPRRREGLISIADSPMAEPSKHRSPSKPRPAKRPAAELSEDEDETYFPPSGKPPPSPAVLSDSSPPPSSPLGDKSSSSAVALVPPTSNKARPLSLSDILEPAPDGSAQQDRMVGEAGPHYSPGPATQEVNRAPSLGAPVDPPLGTSEVEPLQNTQASAVEGVARLSLDPIVETSAPQAAASDGAAGVKRAGESPVERSGLVSNVPDDTSKSHKVSVLEASSSKGDKSPLESALAADLTLPLDTLHDRPASTIQTSSDAEVHSKQPPAETRVVTASASGIGAPVLPPTAAQLPAMGHTVSRVPRPREEEDDDARSSKRHGLDPLA